MYIFASHGGLGGGGWYVVVTQPHQTRVKRGTVAVATAPNKE